MVLSSLNRIFADENLYTMRKTVLYIILLALGLSACTSPDHEAMRQRLKYVSDCNRADTLFSECWIPTVDSLVIYFDRHGSANDRMMAHYVQGRVYHDMGEAPQALECYQHAAEVADTTSNDCDLYTLYAVYGQMANLFHAQFLPDDEIRVLKVAEKIAWKDKDTLSAINTYQLLSRPYYMKSDTDSVLYIEKYAHDLYLRYGFHQRAARTLLVPISIYLDRMQYNKASEAMSVFEDSSGWFDDDNIKKGKELYYYDKGRYHLAMGRHGLALLNFKKVLQAGYIETGYRGILSVYENQSRSDSISKYAKLFAAANDSSFIHVNKENVQQISMLYNYSRQQRIAEENEANAVKTKLYLLLFAVISAMVFILFAFIYYRTCTKNMLQISQLLNEKADIQALLSEKQEQAEIIAMSKDSEIKRITQESNQMLIDSLRNNQQLLRQIEKLNQQISKFSNSDLEAAFSKTVIAQCFQAILDELPKKTPPTEFEWNHFTHSFRNYFPGYYSFITDGNSLTKDQLRVCMMLRLNYRELEMAFFMETDKQRIDRIKSQINNKLFHIANSSSLREHLKNYF